MILDMKKHTRLGEVQLLLNHWFYPFIIHTKQQQFIEVQFRLENTYIQLGSGYNVKIKMTGLLYVNGGSTSTFF